MTRHKLNRRLTPAFFAFAILALGLLPQNVQADSGALSTRPNTPSASSDFRMIEQLSYAGQTHHERLASVGFEHIPILTTWFFFPSGHDREDVDDAVRERIIHHTETHMEDNKTYILDIEHWPTGASNTPEERAESVRKLSEVIDIIKSVRPTVKLGYYSMVPGRNYWDVYENCAWNDSRHELCLEREQRWHDANTELLPLAQKVDFLFPSIYTFYNNPEGWTHYARANIEEAQRLAELAGRKPVYAYIWPRYHGSNNDGLAYTPIDGAFWRLQLEVVHKTGVEGAIVWDVAQWLTLQQVAKNEEWFAQTLDFMRELPRDDQDITPPRTNTSGPRVSSSIR